METSSSQVAAFDPAQTIKLLASRCRHEFQSNRSLYDFLANPFHPATVKGASQERSHPVFAQATFAVVPKRDCAFASCGRPLGTFCARYRDDRALLDRPSPVDNRARDAYGPSIADAYLSCLSTKQDWLFGVRIDDLPSRDNSRHDPRQASRMRLVAMADSRSRSRWNSSLGSKLSTSSPSLFDRHYRACQFCLGSATLRRLFCYRKPDFAAKRSSQRDSSPIALADYHAVAQWNAADDDSSRVEHRPNRMAVVTRALFQFMQAILGNGQSVSGRTEAGRSSRPRNE